MRIVGVTWTQLSNWSVVDVLSSVTLRGEAVSRRRVISIFVFTHFFFFFGKLSSLFRRSHPAPTAFVLLLFVDFSSALTGSCNLSVLTML